VATLELVVDELLFEVQPEIATIKQITKSIEPNIFIFIINTPYIQTIKYNTYSNMHYISWYIQLLPYNWLDLQFKL